MDPADVQPLPPSAAEIEFLDKLRSSYLSTTIPAQSIADEIVDQVFDSAFAIILEHFFDRQAVPYAITWATKQMTDALFVAFQGPDVGVGKPMTAHHPVVGHNNNQQQQQQQQQQHHADPHSWGSWQADPEPQRVPMDACSRSTLRVVYRPRPISPEQPEEDLDATVAAMTHSKSGRQLNKRNLSRMASMMDASGSSVGRKASSVANSKKKKLGGSSSLNSSAARSQRSLGDESMQSDSASRDRSDMLSVATSGSSGKDATAEGSALTTPQAGPLLTKVAGSFSSQQAQLTPQGGDSSSLTSPKNTSKQARLRALDLERQLEEVFRQSPSTSNLVPPHGNSSKVGASTTTTTSGAVPPLQFVVDGGSKVMMVLPVEHRKTTAASEVQFGVLATNNSTAEDSPNQSPTKSSPRGGGGAAPQRSSKRGGGGNGGLTADFYREENGQQLVCSVSVPALGVAVRDRGETRVSSNAQQDINENGGSVSSGYGDGRVTKKIFTKIQQAQASERLNSSEGFREYFPHGPRFVTPTLSSPPPLARGGSLANTSNINTSTMSGELPQDPGLALHEQFHSAMAQRAADGPGGEGFQGAAVLRHHQQGGGGRRQQRPPHHLLGLPPKHVKDGKHLNHNASPLLDTSSQQIKKQFPPALLPIRRPDLLPPLHSSPVDGHESPMPSSSVAAPSSPTPSSPTPAAAQQDFVILQRGKDAPHFKAGKAGGSSGNAHQRKDALQFITEQEEVIKMRRPTKVIIPSSPTVEEDGGIPSTSNPIAPIKGK
ncbi:Hypothetical protein, putative [Bodo saltans]|uniref:Uncharacterized protein n=1 Tax=Bodo saltans TaxID=75058 RepID=A0A0S4JQ14_BODSA|nr:Hypothetical protein, putative [Bodo saltans]|eukprot:CUG91174.1 Hypothetical protein, putative [Bodo saltans]